MGKYTFRTQSGLLDLSRDGKAAIFTAANEAWYGHLWQHDDRTNGGTLQIQLTTKRLHVETHKKYYQQAPTPAHRRAAIGATMDHRSIRDLQRRQGKHRLCVLGPRFWCLFSAYPTPLGVGLPRRETRPRASRHGVM